MSIGVGEKGPRLIVGHVAHNQAKIWGRGDSRHPVMFVRTQDESGKSVESTTVLNPKDGYTGVIGLSGLDSSTDYKIEVSYGSNRKTPEEDRRHRAEGHFETAPSPDKSEPFRMVLGSCNFHGWGPFRNNDKAAEKVAEVAAGADLVIHAGDQVYADKSPLSFTLNDYREAYLSTWDDPGMKRVLSGSANYMIPDDHEIVNGYSEDGELTAFQRTILWWRGHHGPAREQYAEMAGNGKQAFAEFQKSHGPSSHGVSKNYYTFERGQHRFFAMDTRFEQNRAEGRIISEQQREALFAWLLENKEQPKFIVTATPFISEIDVDDGGWASEGHRHQREEIIEFLGQHEIDNVAFLSGDIHGSCHSQMRVKSLTGKEITLHELVSSPINASQMLSRKSFVENSQGTTANGTRYAMQLNKESAIGKGLLPTIGNSNVLAIDVDGDEVEYHFYRTRKDDEGPYRSGRFTI